MLKLGLLLYSTLRNLLSKFGIPSADRWELLVFNFELSGTLTDGGTTMKSDRNDVRFLSVTVAYSYVSVSNSSADRSLCIYIYMASKLEIVRGRVPHTDKCAHTPPPPQIIIIGDTV